MRLLILPFQLAKHHIHIEQMWNNFEIIITWRNEIRIQARELLTSKRGEICEEAHKAWSGQIWEGMRESYEDKTISSVVKWGLRFSDATSVDSASAINKNCNHYFPHRVDYTKKLFFLFFKPSRILYCKSIEIIISLKILNLIQAL